MQWLSTMRYEQQNNNIWIAQMKCYAIGRGQYTIVLYVTSLHRTTASFWRAFNIINCINDYCWTWFQQRCWRVKAHVLSTRKITYWATDSIGPIFLKTNFGNLLGTWEIVSDVPACNIFCQINLKITYFSFPGLVSHAIFI